MIFGFGYSKDSETNSVAHFQDLWMLHGTSDTDPTGSMFSYALSSVKNKLVDIL